ncbi:FAD-dependent oxidoreductase [Actinosynnema sp. CA-248983]
MVVGGGPAGAAAAITLARSGRTVAVLAPSTVDKLGESLPPGAARALADLDVLDTIHAEPRHHPAAGTASAWGSPTLSYRDYLCEGVGCGWHLDRPLFDQALLRAAAQAGAHVIPGRHHHCRHTREGWIVTTPDHTTTADIAIDATGRQAALATTHQARLLRIDHLIGVAATLPQAIPLSHTLIEATPDGWWYAAPQPDHRVLVAFLSDSDIVREHHYATPTTWTRHLSTTTHIAKHTHLQPPTHLTIRQAASHLLDPAVGPDWIAVGDAAMATDPLASAGILTALTSGTQAAHTITQGLLTPTHRQTHTTQTRRLFTTYLHQRRHFYGLEQRWNTKFWQRRRPPEPSS